MANISETRSNQMNDLNTTIVGLMSKTNLDTDLTSYIGPMEQALWAYFTKIINPETPLEISGSHDIHAIANEKPTTGRVFKGMMNFNEYDYNYIIAFRGNGKIQAQFYDIDLKKGIDFNIFDCFSVKDAFDLLTKNRRDANTASAETWYRKTISAKDLMDISDLALQLNAKLVEAKAKLVVCEDRTIIVPERVVVADESACRVRPDFDDNWYKYIELNPTKFSTVALRVTKTYSHSILAGPIG